MPWVIPGCLVCTVDMTFPILQVEDMNEISFLSYIYTIQLMLPSFPQSDDQSYGHPNQKGHE